MAKAAVSRPSAAIYLRISQDPSGERAGVERQRKLCEQLVRRNGWKVYGVFEDNDISAFSGKRRPEYERMLEAVKGGEITAIVAWHPDRLHRSPKELEPFIDLVEQHNVRIATVQGGDYDLTTAAGRMTARVVGAVARHESEHKSERIRAQRADLASKGLHTDGGRRPYGYLGADATTGRRSGMEVDEHEAEVIREVADRALNDGENLRTIANDLNARAIPSASGREWGIASLRAVLTGPRIAGKRQHRGAIVGDAAWPAILDEETWKRLRQRLGDPRVSKRGRPPTALLVGVLRCGICGEVMRTGRRGDGRRNYRCNKMPGTNACGGVSIAAEPTEERVIEMIFQMTDEAKILKRSTDRASATVVELEAEIGSFDARLLEIDDMWACGEFGDGKQARERRERNRNKVEKLRADALERLHHAQASTAVQTYAHGLLRKQWGNMTLDKQRSVIGNLLESITIERAKGAHGPRFDSSRIRKPVPRRRAV